MPTTVTLAVQGAADAEVINGGARLSAYSRPWPFLSSNNPLTKGHALSFIEPLYDTAPAAADVEELANYLALSIGCHALDGWRYLSLAAKAILNGARNEALHLAYYAELRAALSILASSGVGILNTKHFALTSAGTVQWFAGSTHTKTWEALQAWASISSNALIVVDSLRACGLTAGEWADACGTAANRDAVAEWWLINWSVDITRVNLDRIGRNEASYRPNLYWQAFRPLGIEELQFVRDINAACRPAGAGSFDSIDLALVGDLCTKACDLKWGNTTPESMRKLHFDVFRWLTNNKGQSRSDALAILNAITGSTFTAGGRILAVATRDNKDHLGVFSRSFLLLRLASGIQRQQWQRIAMRSPAGRADWQAVLLREYGVHSNLWDPEVTPPDYELLDEDQAQAQEDIEEWIVANRANHRDRARFRVFSLWQTLPGALCRLCSLERVGLLAALT